MSVQPDPFSSTEQEYLDAMEGQLSFDSRHGVKPQEMSEGPLARAIEEQTARLPSDTWLWAAGGSIALSMYLQYAGNRQQTLFVGHWAPTFLSLGIYNKIVKLHGSE